MTDSTPATAASAVLSDAGTEPPICSWWRELSEDGLVQRKHVVACGGGNYFLVADDAPSAVCGNHKAMLEGLIADQLAEYGMTFRAVST